MKKTTINLRMKSLILMAVVLFVVSIMLVSAILPIPYNPWGTVKIDNVAAPNGLPVEAFINNTKYANTTTINGYYSIYVPGDDSDTPQKEGGVSGEKVNFKVNGSWTNENGTWNSGTSRLDLTVTSFVASISITVNSNTLTFNNINPGSSGSPVENPLNITIESNTNYEITTESTSSTFSGSGTLNASNLKWSNSSSTGPWTNYSINPSVFARGSSGGGNHNLYHQLTIPSGAVAGNYNLSINLKVKGI